MNLVTWEGLGQNEAFAFYLLYIDLIFSSVKNTWFLKTSWGYQSKGYTLYDIYVYSFYVLLKTLKIIPKCV